MDPPIQAFPNTSSARSFAVSFCWAGPLTLKSNTLHSLREVLISTLSILMDIFLDTLLGMDSNLRKMASLHNFVIIIIGHYCQHLPVYRVKHWSTCLCSNLQLMTWENYLSWSSYDHKKVAQFIIVDHQSHDYHKTCPVDMHIAERKSFVPRFWCHHYRSSSLPSLSCISAPA